MIVGAAIMLQTSDGFEEIRTIAFLRKIIIYVKN
jgi:hypothetical protein